MKMTKELKKIVDDINKKAGKEVLITGDEIPVLKRITTGDIALDAILGGGWPVGRFSEIIGEESHGKTTVMHKTVAANQARDPKFTTLWVAAEPYDRDFASDLGVDNSRVIIVDTNAAEEVYDIVLGMLESRQVDLVVIDSLPMLIPIAEDEKDMEGNTVGQMARLNNKFFRKAEKAIHRDPKGDERSCTVLVINQWRMQIGVMHGDPRTTPGGKGKNFSFSVRLEVRRGEWREIGPSSSKVKVGMEIKAKTLKNKTAPPYQAAAFDFYFADGGDVPMGEYDSAKSAHAVASALGLLELKGAYIYYRDRNWNGKQRFIDSLREEIDLRAALDNDILTAIQPAALAS